MADLERTLTPIEEVRKVLADMLSNRDVKPSELVNAMRNVALMDNELFTHPPYRYPDPIEEGLKEKNPRERCILLIEEYARAIQRKYAGYSEEVRQRYHLNPYESVYNIVWTRVEDLEKGRTRTLWNHILMNFRKEHRLEDSTPEIRP